MNGSLVPMYKFKEMCRGGMTFIQKAKALDYTKSVKYLLHDHLDRPGARPRQEDVHASELTKDEEVCPRKYALSDATKPKPRTRWLSTSENVTFHDRAGAAGHRRASVRRHGQGHRPLALSVVQLPARVPDPPAGSATCGVKVFKAEEVRFESAVSGASCGIDLLLALGRAQAEARSRSRPCDKDQFKDALVAPLAEHKLRTTYICASSLRAIIPGRAMVSTDAATILYVSKGGYGCQDRP